ncbi:unnamed protein product [Lactuca virosa]|uniref:Uncharacterized protein n=1 Tax=Lactuca virosa TaxID=75947 RepID=A0AAU9PS29_9ASTR|nr:unnamed protein product [Lactuca virosa]
MMVVASNRRSWWICPSPASSSQVPIRRKSSLSPSLVLLRVDLSEGEGSEDDGEGNVFLPSISPAILISLYSVIPLTHIHPATRKCKSDLKNELFGLEEEERDLWV